MREKSFARMMNKFTRLSSVKNVMNVKRDGEKEREGKVISLKGHGKKGSAGN
jgi:hypothetical protein